MKGRLDDVEAEIDQVLDLYQDGLIDKNKLTKRIEPLNEKRQALETKIDTMVGPRD